MASFNGVPVKGVPGYTNAIIAITIGGQYLGDGINGWSGGTTYEFAVASRNPELERPDHDTTDGPFAETVPGPIKGNWDLKGWFKGENIPPPGIENTYILIQAITVFQFNGVILVTRFREIGDLGGAIGWQLTGRTDGTFTTTGATESV